MSDTSTPIVRLAHLSDVHLPPPHPVPLRALFNKRALSVLSWQQHRRHRHLAALGDAVVADIAAHAPTAIAVTGDLTNFGLPSEFVAGADWLTKLPAPTVIVPGNHDRLTPIPWSQGLGLWAPWMAAKPSLFPYVRKFGDVALIGVNSAIASPPFMAYGRVGYAQGERLRAILNRTRALCRIVVIHHPPLPGLVSWRKSLLDFGQVTALLHGAGAELVLHGHSHDATITRVRGTDIPLVGVASASLKSGKSLRQAGWNDFKIKRNGAFWQIDMTRRQIDPNGQGQDVLACSWERPIELPGITYR